MTKCRGPNKNVIVVFDIVYYLEMIKVHIHKISELYLFFGVCVGGDVFVSM